MASNRALKVDTPDQSRDLLLGVLKVATPARRATSCA